MSDGIFTCGSHDFSTNNIDKYDDHMAELEHEYDVRIECANMCGKTIHILVTQKLAKSARRIPRGYLCESCKGKVQNAVIIEEQTQ